MAHTVSLDSTRVIIKDLTTEYISDIQNNTVCR